MHNPLLLSLTFAQQSPINHYWHKITDRTFSGIYHANAFDLAMMIPYFLVLCVLALYGLQACANDTELNPQPLPPQGGASLGDPTQAPDPNKNAGGGADTTGTGSTPAPPAASPDAGDAGAEGGDAADGGDR